MSIAYLPPVRRPLKIFAYDPMLGRLPLYRVTVDVLNEPLKPGPSGSRIQVLDYDGVAGCFYEPVDLDDPALLMQGGMEPTEFDPRFHQQMVYAVAMKVIENFELALGRSFQFYRGKPLLIFPHAFCGANALYDSRRHALLFGYFNADRDAPGANLPGQTIFSCLSHDIIAHEMTHAMTTRLRRYFLSPSNEDVLAFHEGFSDLVAIFQHFSFPSILREALQRNRGQLDAQGPLVELAVQFGQATGERHALRRAIDKPDVTRIRNEFEPHNRGAILVAAVFDAFLRTYQDRTQDLARIATGGAGLLGQSAINSDLADRLAREAVSVATAVLRMCIRAFDYLPPVDVTFGDYLRAMVTADFELNPNDENGLRRQMVEAFMIRGIFPSNISSISEESLRWPRFDDKEPLKFSDARSQNEMTASFLAAAASSSRNSALDAPPDYYRQLEELEPAEPDNGAFGDTSKFHKAIHKWAVDNSRILQLSQREKISVAGVHPSFRIAQDGQLLVEMIIQLVQEDSTLPAAEFGGVPFRGGTTLIVKANGLVQYVIAKPIASQQLSKGSLELAERRQHSQRAFVAKVDDLDAFHSWRDEEFQNRRIVDRVTLAAAHRGLSW